jgi:hypothetical protein
MRRKPLLMIVALLSAAPAFAQDHLTPGDAPGRPAVKSRLGHDVEFYAAMSGVSVSRPATSYAEIGIGHSGANWQLVGVTQTLWMDGRRRQPPDGHCSVAIPASTAQKTLLLWRKALAHIAPLSQSPSADASSVTYVMGNSAGMTYGQTPKMLALNNVVGAMHVACTSGKNLPVLERQIDQTLSMM